MKLAALFVLLAAATTETCDLPPGSPWETSEVTFEDEQIIVEKVSYRVDGLRIFAQICRPRGEGPFPLLISNHGGYRGIGDFSGGACADNARFGFVTALSSYRGEDGSDGAIEICKGEVDDVLELTRITQGLPFVDASRSVMYGISHGGCITLRAVARGVPVAAAAAMVPPTDIARLHADWTASIEGDPGSGVSQLLATLRADFEAFLGGSPAAVPEEYEARSPKNDVQAIASWPGALFVAAGGEDFLLPPSQVCALARDAGLLSYRVTDAGGAVSAEAPAGCAAEGLAFSAGPKPTASWPERRYFVFYDGMSHLLTGPTAPVLQSDLFSFVFSHLPQ
jgi:dipeptidyl aminopeptidase/acylaminoacyl peptidase